MGDNPAWGGKANAQSGGVLTFLISVFLRTFIFANKLRPADKSWIGCPLFRKVSQMDFIMSDMLRLYAKVTQKIQSFIFIFDR